MDFTGFDETWTELKARGIVELRRDDRTLLLGIDRARQPVDVVIGGSGPADDVTVPCETGRIAAALEAVLHKLHLAPLHVLPAGRWREVFDAVSFGMAVHDAWSEIDSQASLEQNTRDALTCGPRDLHLLREFVRVLLADGEADAGQAVSIVATGQLVVALVEPGRPVRLSLAGAGVAAQARDAARHFLMGTSEGSPPHG